MSLPQNPSETRSLHVATHSPDITDFQWLVSPAAMPSLALAAELDGQLTTRIKRLQRELSPARARLVLEQAELRRRGLAKFAAAERMFFTQQGLEQATDEVVARYKARRFEGRGLVFDLCCGIGGDLLALAARGPTSAFDRDGVSALFAAANAQVLGFSEVRVATDDVTTIDLAGCSAWHIDPDRRPHGGRTTRVELHEPPAAALEQMLAKNPHAAIKLAPAATWPEAWQERAEWEWISRGRQCRQLVAWFGELAQSPGQHRATMLANSGDEDHTFVGSPGEEVPVAAQIDRFLFEPDAAVLAAKLNTALAARHQLQAVAAGVAYWTGPRPINDALLSCFEVDTVLPFDQRKLKALIKQRDAGPLEIKVRGLKQDPAELRKRLGPAGSCPYTLLLTRVQRQVVAILARRVLP